MGLGALGWSKGQSRHKALVRNFGCVNPLQPLPKDFLIQHDNDNIDADFSRCRYVLLLLNAAHVQLLGLEIWRGFGRVGGLLVYGRETEDGIYDLEYQHYHLAEEEEQYTANHTVANSILFYSPKSHSAPSRSLPEPKSKTDPSHNGSVWGLVTPSGMFTIYDPQNISTIHQIHLRFQLRLSKLRRIVPPNVSHFDRAFN